MCQKGNRIKKNRQEKKKKQKQKKKKKSDGLVGSLEAHHDEG